MSGETEKEISGWTVDTYRIHNEAMREAEKLAQRERERFMEERDRRYTEVGIEREKALKIKQTADLAALSLARDIQIYKDEKANELREQINSERGHYVSQAELKPIADYVTSQTGPRAITGATVAAFLAAGALLLGTYLGLRGHSQVVTPTVTVTVAK